MTKTRQEVTKELALTIAYLNVRLGMIKKHINTGDYDQAFSALAHLPASLNTMLGENIDDYKTGTTTAYSTTKKSGSRPPTIVSLGTPKTI